MISLLLTFALFFVIIFGFNTLSLIFNAWSVSIEFCDTTLSVFKPENGNIRFQNNKNLNKLITCLEGDKRAALKSQMLSLLIAQNTILNILKNYSMDQKKASILVRDFVSSEEVSNNFEKILRVFKEASKDSSTSFDILEKYMMTFQTINNIYFKLEKLDSCYEMKHWSVQHNNTICKSNIKNQFYLLWGYLVMILGIFILAAGIFLSENVIRGIYNEEIKYVKTNKLRYDWN